MSQPTMSLEEEIVHTIELNSAALTKAAQAYQYKEAMDRDIAEKIPVVIEALVVSRLIDAEDKEACDKALRDPLQTLELLKFAALEHQKSLATPTPLPAKEVDANGRTKAAGAQVIGDVYRSGQSKASEAFDEILLAGRY
jgi:hypothetical protein